MKKESLSFTKDKVDEWRVSLASALAKIEREKIMPFGRIKMTRRSGLRVYINPVGVDVFGEAGLFYSRRSDGPYYRWRYEKESLRWRSSRVCPSVLALRAFCAASWKAVPPALQARLDEHYLE